MAQRRESEPRAYKSPAQALDLTCGELGDRPESGLGTVRGRRLSDAHAASQEGAGQAPHDSKRKPRSSATHGGRTHRRAPRGRSRSARPAVRGVRKLGRRSPGSRARVAAPGSRARRRSHARDSCSRGPEAVTAASAGPLDRDAVRARREALRGECWPRAGATCARSGSQQPHTHNSRKNRLSALGCGTTRYVGDACATPDDCPGSRLYAGDCARNYPNGYCTRQCDGDADCDAGAFCVVTTGGPVCVKSCTTAKDCRLSEGYSCTGLGASGRRYCSTPGS